MVVVGADRCISSVIVRLHLRQNLVDSFVAKFLFYQLEKFSEHDAFHLFALRYDE